MPSRTKIIFIPKQPINLPLRPYYISAGLAIRVLFENYDFGIWAKESVKFPKWKQLVYLVEKYNAVNGAIGSVKVIREPRWKKGKSLFRKILKETKERFKRQNEVYVGKPLELNVPQEGHVIRPLHLNIPQEGYAWPAPRPTIRVSRPIRYNEEFPNA